MSPSVDIHQHLWPESLLAALSRRREPPCLRNGVLRLAGMPDFPVEHREHDLDVRLRRLDEADTDVAVVSLQPTLGLDALPPEEAEPLVSAYHEGVAELVGASGGRLRALAYGEARRGFAGACLAAGRLAAALIAGEDPPLLRRLEADRGFLFVHPGAAAQPAAAPRWWAEVAAYPAETQAAYLAWLARGADAHPRLRVVFALLAGGGPFQLERLASRGPALRAERLENVFLDTASYGTRSLELCLSTFGVQRLLFGSDVPVLAAAPGLRALAGFGNAVADAVRRENPSQLLR